MAWSGGTFTRANPTWTTDASLGIGIEAGRHDAQDNDFTTGINQCLNKDGSNSATGNLNLGGFRYTNSAAATARTDLAQVAQVQDGDYIWLGTTGGTATAQTATATPAITAYKAGQKFRMKIGASLNSTGSILTAHTLNINSLGAKNIVHQSGSNPSQGSWIASAILEVVYDGTNFIIVSAPTNWIDWVPTLKQGVTTIAAGVVYAKTVRVNDTVYYSLSLLTSAAGPAAQDISVSLPVASSIGAGQFVMAGSGHYYRGSTGVSYILSTNIPNSATSTLYFQNDASVGGNFGATPAITIAINERLYVEGSYEV